MRLLYSALRRELEPCRPRTSLLCHGLPAGLCQEGARERDSRAGGGRRDAPLAVGFPSACSFCEQRPATLLHPAPHVPFCTRHEAQCAASPDICRTGEGARRPPPAPPPDSLSNPSPISPRVGLLPAAATPGDPSLSVAPNGRWHRLKLSGNGHRGPFSRSTAPESM